MNHAINYNWNFKPHFNEEFLGQKITGELIDIPHSVKELPFNYFNIKDYEMISIYQKEIDFSFSDDELIYVTFEGVMVSCKVYLNDTLVGENYGGYNAFSIDLTPYYKKGQTNLLSVIVNSNEQRDIPPFGKVIDYLLYGGIYREVYVDILPKINIKDLMVEGNMYGQLRVRTNINNQNLDEYEISYKLKYQDEIVLEFKKETALLQNAFLWDNKNPNLYTLVATLSSKYGTHVKEATFGFRTATFTKDGFYLNGKHLKLLGLNRHQSYAYVGYAMPKSMQEEDARILKEELGVNYVRCSHYPMSKHFLNACDRYGLILLEEIPGWQFVSDEEIWRNRHLKNVEDMITFNFNHPSIVVWGVRINEGRDDHELYTKANEIAKRLDPNRATGGVRNFKNSELLEDVYTYNDFYHCGNNHGLDKPKKVCKNAPYLVTENNGHMFPTKPFDQEDRMIEHTLRHAKVIDAMYQDKRICGESGWCMNDYNTHKEFGSGDMICYHGVNDMFRNPKYAASIFASQQDDFPVLKVLSIITQGEKNAAMQGATLVATNADYIEFYKNDKLINKFYANKNDFPYMPHPPIVINDYVGSGIIDSKVFSEKDAIKLTAAVNHALVYGMDKLKIKHYLLMAKVMMKYKMNMNELLTHLMTYATNWGDMCNTYEVKAYKNDKLVGNEKFGPSVEYKLVCENELTLNHLDTYDVKQIHVKAIDQNDQLLRFCFEPLNIEVEGDIKLLGPSVVNLHAGQTGLYIRSLKKGSGKVIITSRFNKLIINININ